MLSIVLIVLIAGACAAVYFNFFGAKGFVAKVLGLTTIESAAEQRASEQAEIDKQKEEIASEMAALQELEKTLDTREKELNKREADLGEQEEATAAQEQAEKELAAAAEIFAKMDPESAAKAIAGMGSVDEMVKILTNMPSEQAALVMDKMSSRLASDILSAMMK